MLEIHHSGWEPSKYYWDVGLSVWAVFSVTNGLHGHGLWRGSQLTLCTACCVSSDTVRTEVSDPRGSVLATLFCIATLSFWGYHIMGVDVPHPPSSPRLCLFCCCSCINIQKRRMTPSRLPGSPCAPCLLRYHGYCLVMLPCNCYGLRLPCTASLAKWLRRPPRERKIPGSNSACAESFPGSNQTSDLKIGTPVATPARRLAL